MKLLTTLLALGVIAASRSMAASPAVEWTVQNAVVNSARGTELGYIFAEFERDPSLVTPPVLDLLMEVSLYNTGVLPYSQKDLFRAVKIIYLAENPRYLDAMRKLADITSTPGPYERWQLEWRDEINDLASKYVRQNSKKQPVPQYVPGTLHIDQLRAGYVTAALAARHPRTQAQNIQALVTGASIDDVFAAAGAPEFIEIGTEVGTYKGQRTRNESEMRFYYRGLGRVTLRYESGIGWHYLGAIVDPLRFERAMPYRANAAELGQPDNAALAMHELLSGNIAAVHQAVESMAPDEMSVEFTDTAAEVLLQGFADQSTSEAGSAYYAICRALMSKDSGRYAGVLLRVTRDSTDIRIQGLAGSVAADADAADSGQYRPGALSLDAQRAKYPPLYPESTLPSGHP